MTQFPQNYCIIGIFSLFGFLCLLIAALSKQPAGSCTSHISAWLWVNSVNLFAAAGLQFYLFKLLHQAAHDVTATPITAKGAQDELKTKSKQVGIPSGVFALFNFCWWIVGCAWYDQNRDAGCQRSSMDMLLTCVILPHVLLLIVCCGTVCVGGFAAFGFVRANVGADGQPTAAAQERLAKAAASSLTPGMVAQIATAGLANSHYVPPDMTPAERQQMAAAVAGALESGEQLPSGESSTRAANKQPVPGAVAGSMPDSNAVANDTAAVAAVPAGSETAGATPPSTQLEPIQDADNIVFVV